MLKLFQKIKCNYHLITQNILLFFFLFYDLYHLQGWIQSLPLHWACLTSDDSKHNLNFFGAFFPNKYFKSFCKEALSVNILHDIFHSGILKPPNNTQPNNPPQYSFTARTGHTCNICSVNLYLFEHDLCTQSDPNLISTCLFSRRNLKGEQADEI